MRLLLLALLSSLIVAAAAPRDPAYPENVQVRFGNLYWVGTQTLLPRVVQGQVLAPPLETCDLLSLTCELSGETLKATRLSEPSTRRTFNVTRLYDGKISMVSLASMVKFAGQNIAWDSENKLALVSGGQGSAGWRDALLSPATVPAAPYLGPLRASQTPPKTGEPNVQQIVFAEESLKNVTFYSKVADGLRMVGEYTPSTPDNPNKTQACNAQNPKVCELPVPRDALWTLAYLSRP